MHDNPIPEMLLSKEKLLITRPKCFLVIDWITSRNEKINLQCLAKFFVFRR